MTLFDAPSTSWHPDARKTRRVLSLFDKSTLALRPSFRHCQPEYKPQSNAGVWFW